MGQKPKAVLDTNVVVSAVRRGSVTRRVAEAWHQGRFRWLVSKEILDEYIRVFAYPKFQLDHDEITALLNHAILPYVDVIHVHSVIHHVADPDDDKFLACAVDGHADYIVSGDQDLLRLQRYQGIAVVSVNEFLRIIS